MVQLTDFGVKVKKALIDKGKSQKWLIEEVRENTKLFFDSGYLQRMMTGRSTSARIKNTICEILEIEVDE